MVQIDLNNESGEIEIRIKVWALAQIVDNETWQNAIYEQCKILIDEEIEKRMKKLNVEQNQFKNNKKL